MNEESSKNEGWESSQGEVCLVRYSLRNEDEGNTQRIQLFRNEMGNGSLLSATVGMAALASILVVF